MAHQVQKLWYDEKLRQGITLGLRVLLCRFVFR